MTQFDNIGATEIEDQQRREMRERMKEDMIRRIASSSEYSAQELRAMNMRSNPQMFSMGTNTDTSSHFDDAGSELETEIEQEKMLHEDKQKRLLNYLKQLYLILMIKQWLVN